MHGEADNAQNDLRAIALSVQMLRRTEHYRKMLLAAASTYTQTDESDHNTEENMYSNSEKWHEEIWYDPDHISWVVAEVRSRFHDYFGQYLATDRRRATSSTDLARLAEKFGTKPRGKSKVVDGKGVYLKAIPAATDNYNKGAESNRNASPVLVHQPLEERASST